MNLVKKEPVKKLTLRTGKVCYRCALCLRQYNDKMAAAHCFYECRQDPAVLIKCEYRVSVKKDRPAGLAPHILSGIKLDTSAEEARQFAQKSKIKRAVNTQQEGQKGGTDQANALSQGSDSPENAPIEKEAIPPRPERYTQKIKEKTLRDGSRYVCAVCMEKYFTKMEAENCFGSHAAEEEKADQEWLSKYGGNSGVEVDKVGAKVELTDLEKRLAAEKK
jgi:hypothetical protein